MYRSDFRTPLARWLAGHEGVVSLAEFRSWGATRANVDTLVSCGELIRLAPGVFRAAAHRATQTQLLIAAMLVEPRSVIGSASACRDWQLRGTPPSRESVLVPRGVRLTIAGLEVVSTRCLPSQHVVRRPDGRRVTTAARSVFDAAHLLGPRRTESALEQVLDLRLATLAELHELLALLGHPRRPGTKIFRRVLLGRDHGPAVQSDLEYRALAEIRRQGLAEPERQFEVRLADGRLARFDFAWPAVRVALEVDHSTWHDGASLTRRDKSRDRQAALAGWVVPRITEADVAESLSRVIGEVGQLVWMRGAGAVGA